jgi:uncharacterized protein YndB with AHSA1/START domain
MINVTEQIGSVNRRVASRMRDGVQAHTVTISQAYDTDVADLWDACTNPERIPRWFLPISGELRLGGRFQLEGNAGGVIEECEPPHRFFATWEFGGKVSWVDVRVTAESGERARLEIEHIAEVDDDMWTQFGPGAVGIGWDGALMGLAMHVSTGATVGRAQAAAWMASEEARMFYAQSSERWREASVASGTPEAEAAAAAARVTDAYTGAPER